MCAVPTEVRERASAPPGIEVTDGCELSYMSSRITARVFNRPVISPSFIDFCFLITLLSDIALAVSRFLKILLIYIIILFFVF